MNVRGITKKDLKFIIECMRWNKFHFTPKDPKDCFNKSETLKRIEDIIWKLKGGI